MEKNQKPQKINRETVLHQLQLVQPGLSTREIIEQSSCFVFQDGKVMTYNDEIACTYESDLAIEGAIPSVAIVALLQKLKEDELTVTQDGEEITFKGSRRRAGIRCEAEVLLPIDSVEVAEDWEELNEDFLEAVKMVQQTVSKDDSQFALTCVHVTPKWVETCDNFQLTRVDIKTGISDNILIKKASMKHVVDMNMTEFALTDNWIHFRNPIGLILSCRKYVEDFPDLTPMLDVQGSKATFPKGLSDACDKAAVFSSDTADENQVTVSMKAGLLKVRGEGTAGWFEEIKKIKYTGPSIVFTIAPSLLMEITKRHNDCLIGSKRLMVSGGKFTYVSCLGEAE